MAECARRSRRALIQIGFLIRTGDQMTKKAWLLLVALAFAAGCATQEAPKPAPAPEPKPATAPAPAPAPVQGVKPAPAKPKPVAEKVTFAADVLLDFDESVVKPEDRKSVV